MRSFNALALCAGLALTANAGAETPGADGAPAEKARECFRAVDVHGYSVIDEHSIRVRVSPRRTYTLTTSENAADLDRGRHVGMSTDMNWVCTGDARGAVYITGGDMGNRYAVDVVTRDPYPLPEEPADETAAAGQG